MKSKGRIRKFFPGANSAYGFFSFYEYLYGSAASKVFILKGGPGTGKSTLIHRIGEDLRKGGFDVEYHYYSANPRSLDGMVVPALGVAMLDGTAPHIVDPVYPGVPEEIINLGAYWDERLLKKNEGVIRALADGIKPLYRQAYVYLAAAKSYREAVDGYYSTANHHYINALASLALELVEEIFGGKNGNSTGGNVRRLFASAITSQGTLHHLENLLEPFSLVFILNGEDGGSKKKIMAKVAEVAVLRGFYVEAFHCALDHRQVDHILIPELEVALVNNMEPHTPKLAQHYRCVDTGRLAAVLPQGATEEKETFSRNYAEAIHNAVMFLEKANQRHNELEQYYIPAMRFAQIEALGEQLLEKIRRQG